METRRSYTEQLKKNMEASNALIALIQLTEPYMHKARADIDSMLRKGASPHAVWSLIDSPYWQIGGRTLGMVRAAIEYYCHLTPGNSLARMEFTQPGCTMLRQRLRDMLAVNVDDMFMLTWMMCRYLDTGRKHYEVDDDLALKLLHTELRGLRGQDLRLPYETVCIKVPPSVTIVMKDEVPWQKITSVVIAEEPEGSAEVTNIVGGYDPATKSAFHQLMGKPTYVRAWRVSMFGEAFMPSGDRIQSQERDAFYRFSMQLFDEKPLDEIMEFAICHNSEATRPMWIEGFRWALNVMIYATSVEHGELFVKDKKAAAMVKRAEQAMEGSKLRRNLLTAAAQLEPGQYRRLKDVVTDRAKLPADSSGIPNGRTLSVRTRVTGHWRRQVCGAGRALRKLTWIEPFWRGPMFGELGSGTHVLR
jgi:hypothetical protein